MTSNQQGPPARRGRPGPRPRETSVLAWMRLARVYGKVQLRSARHLRPFGLTVAQFDVLAQVGAAEGLSQQDLAERLLVTKGNICGLLDRLERAGLVTRRPDPADRRVNRLVLTPAGAHLYAEAVPVQEALIAEMFSVLPPRDRRTLRTLLRRLDHAISLAGRGN
jgi:DNA-binding MarR family transcriptional regulator